MGVIDIPLRGTTLKVSTNLKMEPQEQGSASEQCND